MRLSESYRILGLPFGSDIEAIKEAYRKLVKRYHPDHGCTDSVYFQKVQEAYTVLKKTNPPKRHIPRDVPKIVDVFAMGELLISGRTPHLKRYAARQLGASGKISAYGFLRKGLYDKNGDVVTACVRSIGELKVRHALPELAALFDKSPNDIKKEILEACRKIGPHPMTETMLRGARRDISMEIRKTAHNVMQHMRSRSHV